MSFPVPMGVSPCPWAPGAVLQAWPGEGAVRLPPWGRTSSSGARLCAPEGRGFLRGPQECCACRTSRICPNFGV